MTKSCYFCGEIDELETHHIVPKRYDGSDSKDNLLTVCPTCHRKLERVYNKRFYDELGVTKQQTENHTCHWDGCTATDTTEITGVRTLCVCDHHLNCSALIYDMPFGSETCKATPARVVETKDGYVLLCENHVRCSAEQCGNTDTVWMERDMPQNVYCEQHHEEVVAT